MIGETILCFKWYIDIHRGQLIGCLSVNAHLGLKRDHCTKCFPLLLNMIAKELGISTNDNCIVHVCLQKGG